MVCSRRGLEYIVMFFLASDVCVCFAGHTCRVLETGDIIKAGQTYEIGGLTFVCRDKNMPNWDIAKSIS